MRPIIPLFSKYPCLEKLPELLLCFAAILIAGGRPAKRISSLQEMSQLAKMPKEIVRDGHPKPWICLINKHFDGQTGAGRRGWASIPYERADEPFEETDELVVAPPLGSATLVYWSSRTAAIFRR